jgi:hypothetical protein
VTRTVVSTAFSMPVASTSTGFWHCRMTVGCSSCQQSSMSLTTRNSPAGATELRSHSSPVSSPQLLQSLSL